MNAYYNRHTGRMIPITGRCYKVPCPLEDFTDFDLIAHRVPAGAGSWAVTHRGSGLVVSQECTRAVAVSSAMRVLKSHGRPAIDARIEKIRRDLLAFSEPKGPGYV